MNYVGLFGTLRGNCTSPSCGFFLAAVPVPINDILFVPKNLWLKGQGAHTLKFHKTCADDDKTLIITNQRTSWAQKY